MSKDNETEQKILEAAELVFQEKGYSGARMREIAERAGTNKGLLHYYFKTKDKLFEAIFSVAFNRLLSKIRAVLELDMPLDEKIDLVVDQYMGLLLKNPGLPRFVLHELHKNPDQFVARHLNENVKRVFSDFKKSIGKEAETGKIIPIDPRQLLMNLISMVIFPFVGRPMLQVVFGADNNEFKQLLNDRKEHIKLFIKQAIRP